MKRPRKKNKDPSRNLHKHRGAAVTVPEVLKHKLRGCGPCRGTGLEGDPTTSTTPCVCATRRFLKAHPEIVMDRAGSAWWPALDPLTQDQPSPDPLQSRHLPTRTKGSE